MPKMKSNSGAKKRVKVLKSGKVKRGQTHRRHLLESKSTKRNSRLRQGAYVHETDLNQIRHLLPYG